MFIKVCTGACRRGVSKGIRSGRRCIDVAAENLAARASEISDGHVALFDNCRFDAHAPCIVYGARRFGSTVVMFGEVADAEPEAQRRA